VSFGSYRAIDDMRPIIGYPEGDFQSLAVKV
jgi:hypothetical protein